MSVGISFDEYDLDHVSEWEESVPTRIKEVQIPRRHGTYHEETIFYSSRKISLRGTIFLASWDEVRAELYAMKKRLSGGTKKLTFDDESYIWATLEAFNHNHSALRGQGKVADFTIALICKDPFWYANSPLSGDDSTMEDADTIVINNTGNIMTPPTIIITPNATSMTSAKFTNTSDDDKYCTYNAIMTVGEELVINCDECTMEKDDIDVLDDFVGSFWNLIPGTNTIKLEFDEGTSGDVTIAYRIRNI